MRRSRRFWQNTSHLGCNRKSKSHPPPLPFQIPWKKYHNAQRGKWTHLSMVRTVKLCVFALPTTKQQRYQPILGIYVETGVTGFRPSRGTNIPLVAQRHKSNWPPGRIITARNFTPLAFSGSSGCWLLVRMSEYSPKKTSSNPICFNDELRQNLRLGWLAVPARSQKLLHQEDIKKHFHLLRHKSTLCAQARHNTHMSLEFFFFWFQEEKKTRTGLVPDSHRTRTPPKPPRVRVLIRSRAP